MKHIQLNEAQRALRKAKDEVREGLEKKQVYLEHRKQIEACRQMRLTHR